MKKKITQVFLLCILLFINSICTADDSELFVNNDGSSRPNVLIMFNLTSWYGGNDFIDATKTEVKKFLQNTSGINVAIVTTKNIYYSYSYKSNYWSLTPTVLSHFKPIESSLNELISHVDGISSINNSGADHSLLLFAWEYFSGLPPYNEQFRIEDSTAINNNTLVSPIVSGCNNNFVLLFTRGYSSLGSSDSYIRNTLGPLHNYPTSLSSFTLVTMGWIFRNIDAAPTIEGDQHIKLFSVFMPQSDGGNKNLLTQASELSGGRSFEINQTEDLITTMTSFQEIVKKDSIIVSPVVSTDAFGFHSQDKKIYFSLFKPEEGSAWKGNLKCYNMGADGIIYDKNNNPAIDDATGFFKTTSHSFWSNSVDGNDVLSGGMAENISKDRNVCSDILDASYNHYSNTGTALFDPGNKLHEDNSNITTSMLSLNSSDPDRNKLLKWSRGVDVDDLNENGSTTDNRATIGDPLHTKPVVTEYYTGDKTLYMTTNDGFFHAVNPETGNTIFSFIPRDLLPQLRLCYKNVIGNDKIYGLDAPITILKFTSNGAHILDSHGGAVVSGNGVLAILPMRRGGRNIYALNISDRNNPNMSWTIRGGKTSDQQTTKLTKTITTIINTPTNVGISDGLDSMTSSFTSYEVTSTVDAGIGDFTKLGQTWSIAMPAMVKWQGSPKVVFFFGGGYDEQTDSQTTIQPNGMGNAIFMVDAISGEKLWQASSNSANGTDTVISEMDYGIASNLALVDINQDGFTDFIIATDIGGQVFRIDINNNNVGPASFATGGLIARLSDNTLSGSRRFFESANVSLAPNNTHLNIAVGSGFRAKPHSTYTQDRIYVIKDKNVFSKPANYTYANGNIIQNADLYNATENLIQSGTASQKLTATTSLNNKHGWYIYLEEDGEKLFSKLQTYAGVLTFTTYTPPDTLTTTSCTPKSGYSHLYALDIENATAVANLTGGTNLSKNDRKKRLKLLVAPEPSIINRGQNGIKVCVGTECFDNIIPGGMSSIKKTYWRENH